MSEPCLTFTMVHRSGALTTSRTEYICGRNTRSEFRNCTGHSPTQSSTDVQYEYGPLRAHIWNRDLGYNFELDLAARIYTGFRANEYGHPVWVKPRPVPPHKRSGKTVHIHTETVDTGERRDMFGYTARHVITRTRKNRDSQLLSESESDGWYIDPPVAWLILHPAKHGSFCYLVASTNGERDDFKFTHTGERETGFMLQTTQTNRSYSLDQTGSSSVHESISRQEIVEFSETPLHPELFVPLPDFSRVPQLPNAMRYPVGLRVRLRWEMLKDSFRLRNSIDKFIGPRSWT